MNQYDNICITITDLDGALYYFPAFGIITRSLDQIALPSSETDYIDRPPSAPEIQGFIFVITTKCNLRCKYCYSVNQASAISMAVDHPASILDNYLRPEAKMLFVNFFGGEPSLEMETIKHTVKHLRHIGGKTIYFRITTNGLMDPHDLDYLIDNRFSIVVSSDGSPDKSSTLDKRRVGRRVARTILHLVKRDVPFRVRCTITSENLDSLPSAIHYWQSLGVKHVHLEPYHPAGSSAKERRLLPSADEFIDMFKQALDAAEEYGLWIQTGTYMNLLNPSTYFCTGAAGKYRVFNPDGSITTCYRVQNCKHPRQEFIVGKWDSCEREKVINFKWEKNNHILCNHSVEQMRTCDGCHARLICGGGCLMRNLGHGGAITSPDPWICKVRKSLFEDAITRTWHAIHSDHQPVVFGRFVFESMVLNHPSMGKPIFGSSDRSDLKNDSVVISSRQKDMVIDIYEALGLRRQLYTSPAYLKVSRAECI